MTAAKIGTVPPERLPISAALALAFQHHQAGRLQAAEQIYRQILQADPNHADAIHLLGVLAHQLGQHAVAVEYIQRAIGLRGDVADFHNNLSLAYRAVRDIPAAVACCRRALELKPDYVEAHSNLGNALKDQGKLDEAVACYRRAVELKPDFAKAHSHLGAAFQDQGKLDQAAACFQRALALEPDDAAACNSLGIVCKGQGKPDQAVACYRRALELKPGFAEAHSNLGNAFRDQRKLDEAIACYRRALELKPQLAEIISNLGAAFCDQGKLDEAAACCRRALELKPDCAEAHYNLGNALKDHGKLDEPVACFRRAVQLKPDYAEAHNNLSIALKDQGKLDEAVACGRRALELLPDCANVHSNLLFTLHYCTGVTLAELAETHAEYDRRHAAPLGRAAVRQESVRARHGRPRVGFVSPDLGRHPVGYLLVRVLERLGQLGKGDRHLLPERPEGCCAQKVPVTFSPGNLGMETICYSDRIAKDDMTCRLQAAATHWRDVLGTSDERLAEQIRADGVDILFDLAGHTAHNRLLTLARKPAPIQITWLGYVGTTGLAAMDYILADRFEIPPESEAHYREKVLRLPDGYVCFDAPEEAPPVGPLPAMAQGCVTFGCFNNLAKITRQAMRVWAEILRRVPQSRLVLKYRGLEGEGFRRELLERLAAERIDAARVELLGRSPRRELLADYNRIDLALDPFPYSGGLTTCEALWMGVPVVTCPGETFASRHALSHLSNAGLTETIAHDLDEYVELAVALAHDLPRLAGLRAGLRQRMAASPLCDAERFVDNLASLLQDLWQGNAG
jgi:predicted O-linked N-acetylglucosamine transferase (SPINDLY family)